MGEARFIPARDLQTSALIYALARDGVLIRYPMVGRALPLVDERQG